MTDEKFIEWILKISDHCYDQMHCEDCRFYHEEADCEGIYVCVIRALARQISDEPPCDWNMEEIERIIKL